MKTELILLFVFFTLKAYTQNNQLTKVINNTANCSGAFSGMEKWNQQFSMQRDISFMWLGYLNSNQQNTTYRGYQEFNVNSVQTIPPDITNDNITEATLIGELISSSQSNSTVNIFRHDDQPFTCSKIDTTGWKYLDGNVISGGARTQIAAFNFGNTHKIEELNVLEHVRLKRQVGKLILGYKNASEATQNMKLSVRVEVAYNIPSAPATAPSLTYNPSYVTQTTCRLSWSAPAGPLLGYKVYKSGNPNPIATVNHPTTSADITGLAENTSYSFFIVAYNSGGNSPNSNTVQVSTPYITGPSTVCYDGSTFTLNNSTSGIIWLVTGPFTIGSAATANSVTVVRTGSGSGSGILTAKIADKVIATKTITPCATPVISGPTLVCSSGTTFTASNWQTGFTWVISSNLSNGSNSNSTVSVGPSASYFSPGSEGWISIKNSSGQQLVKKEVWVGIPAPEIQGPANSGGGANNYYAHIDYLSAATDYHWTMYAMSTDYCYTGNAYTLAPNGNMATATFNCNGDYQLYLGATNACGTSQGYPDILDIHVTGAGYYSYSASYSMSYPNPSSNILNIEIDAQAITRTNKALEQTTTGGKQLKIDPAYDIRLYDGQGNLLRNAKTKGGTVQFNVANLPNGIYYLHIYDGVNAKPEMRQIVVEH